MPTFHFLSTPQLQISCILFSVSPHYINKLAAGYVHLLHAATTTKTYNSPLFQVQYLPAKFKGAFCKDPLKIENFHHMVAAFYQKVFYCSWSAQRALNELLLINVNL